MKAKTKTISPNLSLDEYAEVSVVFGIGMNTGLVNRDGAAKLLKKIQVLVK